MNQIIPQTEEQQLQMYMKLTKKELASMLIQAKKIIEQRSAIIKNYDRENDYEDKMDNYWKTQTARHRSPNNF